MVTQKSKQFCCIIATSAQFVVLAVFVTNRHNYAGLHRKQKSFCRDSFRLCLRSLRLGQHFVLCRENISFWVQGKSSDSYL